MGNTHSPVEFVSATVFLSAVLFGDCVAQAQTPTNASDNKRVQVLRIVEVGSAQANSVKRSKSAATAVKKKRVARNTIGHTRPTAPSAASPDSPIPIVESATSKQNNGAQPSMEQTGILTFGDRAVAFASFSGEIDGFGPLTKDVLRTAESKAVDDAVIEKQTDNANRETSQTGARSSSIFHVLAIFGGAILAGFGLISSRRSRESRELAGNT
jgi:hypothetical protein